MYTVIASMTGGALGSIINQYVLGNTNLLGSIGLGLCFTFTFIAILNYFKVK